MAGCHHGVFSVSQENRLVRGLGKIPCHPGRPLSSCCLSAFWLCTEQSVGFEPTFFKHVPHRGYLIESPVDSVLVRFFEGHPVSFKNPISVVPLFTKTSAPPLSEIYLPARGLFVLPLCGEFQVQRVSWDPGEQY